MGKTNDFFVPGKLSVILDGGAGSSGKGKIGAFIMKHADNVQFVCNTFSANASHTIVEEVDGKRVEYIYKALNSCAHDHHKFQKMYIGHGAAIDLNSLLKEIKQSGIPVSKLGISPVAVIIQQLDADYEAGKVCLDGNQLSGGEGTIKTGTTASGSGAARARKVLRKSNIVYARDVEELGPYICDVSEEIIGRLDRGQSGLLEIAQGFQLSYGLPQFAPNTTSRNCTVAAGFDDMMIPPVYLGKVILNFRTFPIRIHSYKYLAVEPEELQCTSLEGKSKEEADQILSNLKRHYGEDCSYVVGHRIVAENTGAPMREYCIRVYSHKLTPGTHLTWEQIQSGKVKHKRIDSYSGDFYKDQRELDWDTITNISGSPIPLMECTTLTKLPRRVATFSAQNLMEAIRYNRSLLGTYISVNFANYVDYSMYKSTEQLTGKMIDWLEENISPVMAACAEKKYNNVSMKYLGTSEYTDDTIIIGD